MFEDADWAIALFGLVVLCALIYAIYRLSRDPPPNNLSRRSQTIARIFGVPKLFDALFARPLTRREKLGWLVFAVIVVLAVVFDGKR